MIHDWSWIANEDWNACEILNVTCFCLHFMFSNCHTMLVAKGHKILLMDHLDCNIVIQNIIWTRREQFLHCWVMCGLVVTVRLEEWQVTWDKDVITVMECISREKSHISWRQNHETHNKLLEKIVHLLDLIDIGKAGCRLLIIDICMPNCQTSKFTTSVQMRTLDTRRPSSIICWK